MDIIFGHNIVIFHRFVDSSNRFDEIIGSNRNMIDIKFDYIIIFKGIEIGTKFIYGGIFNYGAMICLFIFFNRKLIVNGYLYGI